MFCTNCNSEFNKMEFEYFEELYECDCGTIIDKNGKDITSEYYDNLEG